MGNKVRAFDATTIYEVEDKINEFGETNDIFATQLFKTDKGYDCLVHFRGKESEQIISDKSETKPYSDGNQKGEFATEKQKQALTKMKISYPENISKKEAWIIIKNRSGNK